MKELSDRPGRRVSRLSFTKTYKKIAQIVIALVVALVGFTLPAYADATSIYAQSLDGRDNTMSLVTIDVPTGHVSIPLLDRETSWDESILPPLLVPDAINLSLENKSPFDDRETVVVVTVERPYGCDHANLQVRRDSPGAFTIAVGLQPDRSSCLPEAAPQYAVANLGVLVPGHYTVKATSGDRVYDQLNFQVRQAISHGLAH